jgi:hypothetical protein
MRRLLIISITLFFSSCNHEPEKCCGSSIEDYVRLHDSVAAVESAKAAIIVSQPDTSNQGIYDFMKIVIAEKKLDLTNGLAIDPEQGFDINEDDKAALQKLLIEPEKKATIDTGDYRTITFTAGEVGLEKCLTKTDIKQMLLQKAQLASFQWDNSRLGFNMSNDKNWFSFSIPLFSKDKSIAIMKIEDGCPGLCGTGETVLFRKQQNKWTCETGGQWIH